MDGWPRWCGWEVGEVGGGQVGRRGGCEGAVRLVACVCVGGCGRMAGRWDGRGGVVRCQLGCGGGGKVVRVRWWWVRRVGYPGPPGVCCLSRTACLVVDMLYDEM